MAGQGAAERRRRAWLRHEKTCLSSGTTCLSVRLCGESNSPRISVFVRRRVEVWLRRGGASARGWWSGAGAAGEGVATGSRSGRSSRRPEWAAGASWLPRRTVPVGQGPAWPTTVKPSRSRASGSRGCRGGQRRRRSWSSRCSSGRSRSPGSRGSCLRATASPGPPAKSIRCTARASRENLPVSREPNRYGRRDHEEHEKGERWAGQAGRDDGPLLRRE